MLIDDAVKILDSTLDIEQLKTILLALLSSSNDFTTNVTRLYNLKLKDKDILNSHLITNFPKEQLHLYKEAINKSGDKNLFIGNDARNKAGGNISGYLELRAIEYLSTSNFWKVFEEIKEKYEKQEANIDFYETWVNFSELCYYNSERMCCCIIEPNENELEKIKKKVLLELNINKKIDYKKQIELTKEMKKLLKKYGG